MDLQLVVTIVLYFLGAAIVFGLLFLLIRVIGRNVEGEAGQFIIKWGNVLLLVLAILLMIFLVISLLNGGPVFHWGGRRVV